MAKKLTTTTTKKAKAAKAKTAPAKAKGTTMTLEEAMRELKSLGNEGVRAQNAKSGHMGSGAGDNQFGVSRGDVGSWQTRSRPITNWHWLCGKPETLTLSSWRRS